MKELLKMDGFGIVVGMDWTRWYVGISYEPQGNARAVILRIGPAFIYFITQCEPS